MAKVVSPDSAPDVLGKCSDGQWSAPSGTVGENARLVVDTGCPIKLNKVLLVNGVGDFSTKMFSILGAHNKSGPWKTLYQGELQKEDQQVFPIQQLLSATIFMTKSRVKRNQRALR